LILQRLLSPFREFGLFAGLLYMMDRAMGRLSSRLRLFYYELMVQPIPEAPILPERLGHLIEVREIREGDAELDRMAVRPGVLPARFRQNAVCLGAFQKGELVGYMWFCHGAYEEDEVRCTFVVTPQAEAVFDFDFHIFPEHRLGLGFAALWDGANRLLRGRGVRHSFSRVSRFNLASRNAHAHLGWKLAGRAFFLQAWRCEVGVATVYPFVHVSIRESSRMPLRLRPDALLERRAQGTAPASPPWGRRIARRVPGEMA
jgi:hypothetical protein